MYTKLNIVVDHFLTNFNICPHSLYSTLSPSHRNLRAPFIAIVGFGIYLFVEYMQSSSSNSMPIGHNDEDLIKLGRGPFLALLTMSSNIWDDIYSAWFICTFVGVGFVLFIISCFGCIGASTRNGCCISCYALLVMLLILIELGCAAFMIFDHNWEHEIPNDNTGNFRMIFGFLKEHWNILKWVAIGIVVFEAVLFFLALVVKAANTPEEYDSDEEFINPTQSFRQPLINRPPPTGVPFAGAVDQRASRNEPWSACVRDKYGMNASDQLTYDPNYAQGSLQRNEERGGCTIF